MFWELKGQQNVFKTIAIGLRKFLFWSATSIILLLFVLIILLQTPVFQNYLGDKAIDFINSNTRQTAKFTNIEIKWFDFVEIKGLEIKDYAGKVLLSADAIKVDYELSRLLYNNQIAFDDVSLSGAKLNFNKYADSLDINLIELIKDLNSFKPKPADSLAKPKPMQLIVHEIHLDEFQFSYNNELKDSLSAERFDYGHFLLDVPVGSFEDFYLVNDTIEARIISLAAIDKASRLSIDALKAYFRISNVGLELNELELLTPNSHVRDMVHFRYNGLDDLGYFVDSVEMDINLVNSRVGKKDLDYFAEIPGDPFTVFAETKIKGKVPGLSLQEATLKIGNKTNFSGNIDFMGLPNIDETFIDARIKKAEVYANDLKPFLTDSIINRLGLLREISFSGHFLGFTHDFVTNASFQTVLGNVDSDLNLKFSKGWDYASYSGKLNLEAFDVGKLLGQEQYVGKVNMKGALEGQGVTAKRAKLYLNTTFTDSEFFGYKYDTIQAEGELASEFFSGKLRVVDPNCTVDTQGQVNLSESPEQVLVKSEVGFIDLQELGFSDDFLTLKGTIDADFSGLNLDSLQGELSLSGLDIHWKQDSIALDTVHVVSHKQRNQRKIEVELPDVRMKVEGNFLFTQLISDVRVLVDEVQGYFDPSYSSISQEYREQSEVSQYSIDFDVEYDNISQYIKLFDHDIYISPKGVFEGTYFQRQNATLSLFTEVDSINYDGVGYKRNTFDMNFSKDLDSAGIIASVFINSEEQVWRQIPKTRDFALEAVWYNNKISLNTSVYQPDNNSSATINGELKLLRDRLTFNVLPSRLIIFGDQWFFNPFNKIIVTQSEVTVDRLELYQNSESILLKGVYSDSSRTDLSLDISNFSLKSISPMVPYDLGGILNSKVNLSRKQAGTPYVLNSELTANEFNMNDFLIGDISGLSEWNPEKQRLGIDFNVKREGVSTMDVDGFYSPNQEEELDINAKFNQANLQLINPFFQSLFSKIGGFASGEVDISGSLKRPTVIGSSDIESGTFRFDYLGTTYDFNGNIAFDNKSIKFNGIRLLDRDGNRASFSGVIKHQFFDDFSTDLKLAVSNFQLLNTTQEDNSLYYGTAQATGDIEIIGPVDDLLIKANAVTNKGTKLYIPLSGSTEQVTQKEYITFVNLRDTSQTVDLEQIVENSISGVRLDFEIDVTPDAYVELIFDIRTGDIIRGRGTGNLNLSLDTNGEFELFGDLTISEGAYNFTIPNFINKEFNIVPGGTISWYGDPYSGILNLNASYRQLAAPSDYSLTSNSTEDQQVKQKYPVLVIVSLTGEMLTPNIDFKIELEDSQASATTEAEQAITSINNDEQELKRQVFSLLILRKISPQQQFDIGNAGAVGGSLSEFFSNQFSYFISQVDENLEVDIDLSSLDQNAFNTFQLRLSYTFLDGRLRVSGGGGIPQDGEDVSASNYLGDWSVRYLLTSDGHLRVKAFSQTEQLANTLTRESGVSFQYLKSFNDFRDLITKSREESIATKPKDISKEIEANKGQKPPSK